MKGLKKLLTVVLAGAMVFATSAVAFADSPQYEDTSKFYLTKQLNAATTFGEINHTYKFLFEPDGSNINGPVEFYKTISINRASDGTVEELIGFTELNLAPSGGDIAWGTNTPHAGVFKFKVTEDNTDTIDNVSYDTTTSYTLSVAYKNEDDGTLSVGQVSITKDGTSPVEKIDEADTMPTDENSDGVIDKNEATDFKFTNTLTKIIEANDSADEGEDIGAGEAPYFLKNKTEGDYADKTKQFSYKISVELPKGTSMDTITGKKQDAAGNLSGDTITFTEKNAEVTLADGESFYIQALPVGAVTTATLTKDQAYTVEAADTYKDSEFTTNYKTHYTTVDSLEDNGAVEYTNTYIMTNLTGLVMNNLPFVTVIALVIACAFFAMIGRRRQEER